MNRAIKYSVILYVCILLINALLLPPINFISLDNFLFPVALISIFYSYAKERVFKWSFVLVIFTIIGCLYSNYSANGLSFGEFLWSIRVLKVFTVGWSVYYLTKEYPVIFNKMILISFILFALINALELIEWNVILNSYAPNQIVIDELKNSFFDGRIFGVFSNPNSNGLVLSLFGYYFLLSKEKYRYLLVMITFSLLLMTQSRTAFIAFGFALLLFLLFKIIEKGKVYGLVTLALGSILVLFIAKLKLTNLSSLFNGTAFKSNSVNTRFEIGNEVLRVNESNIVFGQGKITNIPRLVGGSIDNEFLYVYLEYGLYGIIASLLFIILISCFSFSIENKKTTFGLILIMLICGLTNLSFSSLEVSGVFMVLFITSFANKKNVDEHKAAQNY